MRGGRQLAKPDVARPLDGRVRAHCGTPTRSCFAHLKSQMLVASWRSVALLWAYQAISTMSSATEYGKPGMDSNIDFTFGRYMEASNRPTSDETGKTKRSEFPIVETTKPLHAGHAKCGPGVSWYQRGFSLRGTLGKVRTSTRTPQ